MSTCQYCGANNPAGASFCDGCGAALTASAVAQAQATAQAQVASAHAARAQVTAKQSAVHANSQLGTGRLPPQTMLGKRYLILKTIGRGGMAAVYQASDTKSNRVVAIKEMSQDTLSPEDLREALDSFKRESGLLQKLKHPNLPRVFSDFSEDGRHYLVMEYIDGETLEQKLLAAKGPLPEAAALGWARQLCSALGYLHSQHPPIIFRDLKPANVMVTRQGEVKLIDFGIARLFSPRQTRDTQALGTPGYAPPEQYGSSQTDARADIYALGATLYHLLTNYDVGRTPFALPPLRSRNPAISERTATAIEWATRLDRKDRPNDIGALAQALGVSAKTSAKTTANAGATAGATAGAGAPFGAARQWQRPTAGPGAAAQPGQRNVVNSALEAAMRAARAGILAGGVAAIQAQMNPQASKSPAVAFRDAAIAAARTATGPSVALTVQPREIDLNQLRSGQDGSATLTISGPTGAPVAGALKPLAPWLHLDRTQFNGVSTLVQVTARTSEMSGAGPQRGTIEISAGAQRMYIPVRLEVIAAPVAPKAQPKPQRQPKAQPQPPKAANAARGASPFAGLFGGGQAAAPAGGPGAQATAMGGGGGAQQTVTYVAPRQRQPRHPRAGALMSRTRSLGGLRLALSLLLALLLAFGLPALINAFAQPQLTALIASPFWRAWALLGVGVLGALIGAPLAYIGAAGSPGRVRTGALLAGVGAIVAVSNGVQLQLTPAFTQALPGAAQLGALALTLPLLVGVGAAIGAQSLVSRGLLTVARYVAARFWLAQLLAALVGGWLGLTIAQTTLSAVFQSATFALALVSGCGLILGVAVGLMLATPVGYLVRRFAFG